MSRIGEQIITIPPQVEASFAAGVLTVKGPKGVLTRSIRDEVSVMIENGTLSVKPSAKTRLANNLWGTYASHAKNMITGVTDGYKKDLEVHGVGYRAEVSGKQLTLRVGYSHPVVLDIPEGLSVSVKDNGISVEGYDKELVGEFSARIRRVRKPEPYKGKGIRYADEFVRRKQGKKSE